MARKREGGAEGGDPAPMGGGSPPSPEQNQHALNPVNGEDALTSMLFLNTKPPLGGANTSKYQLGGMIQWG